MVRAKMTVQSVVAENEGKTIVLNPVVCGSDENKEFYRWTPGGEVTLYCLNEKASAEFEVGKSYYVDFSPAE